MAKTLYELAMEYLNQGMPDITQAPRTITPTTPPAVTVPPQDPNAPTARILPMPGGGGGGGNNVYNSDPNSTRTQSNYSPYAYRQAFGKTDYQDFDPSSTYAAKQMEMNPEYYEGKQLTGLPGAAQNYLKNSFLGKGLSALGDKLPVNRRAILENELLGSGMQLNDIGQFVSDGGDINKADGSNIMAGYNAAKVTQETFDKRRATIEKNMKDPKQKAAKLAALDAAEASFFGAKTKADMVFDDKSLAKDPTYKSLAEQIAVENDINLKKEQDENNIFNANDKLNNNDFDGVKNFAGLNNNDFDGVNNLGAIDNNDFDGIQNFGGINNNDFGGLVPITGGLNNNDFDGVNNFGGLNNNDFDGVNNFGGLNNNDFDGVQNFGGLNNNDFDGVQNFGGLNNNDFDGVNNFGGLNNNDYTGNTGPITGGTNNNDYDSGLGDYQVQPSTPSYTPSPGDGGEGGNNNSGGKIVCTMMNESYGFGLFRNKIWMKFHKDLAPEYQKGYHKIFLPLIKIAKRNKIVKKVLEHIAIHSTIDMRQATRGKTHLLGRVYRKILLPLCYFVGKNG